MMTNRMIATALAAAALALPAYAQRGGSIAERARQQAAGQRPAPQPAPAQAQTNGQQGQPADIVAFADVHAMNQLVAQAGDMAGSRGASDQVKELGKKVADDHRRLDGELAGLLKTRDKDLNALPAPNQQNLQNELAQLNTKSGDEFDKEFTAFLTRNGVAFVDTLKRARDVVQGKDSQLKKFLDDAENTEEDHLTSARQLKSQRQARTPPAR
jgi:predicted outer membrane protein